MATPQYELSDPPSDAISAIKFAPASLQLLVASWDKNVYLYDTSESGGKLLRTYQHRAPVLDVCFGDNDEDAYTAGLDWDVRRLNLSSGDQTVLSSHTAGVKSLVHSSQHQILVSASWDSNLNIHHLSSPSNPPTSIALPSKPFSISLTATKLVVAMASRALQIYDLASLASASSSPSQATDSQTQAAIPISAEPWQRRESSLKFMTRAVACMPNDAGYASSSIEGRVAVEWFDPSPESQARKYAFKCHRQANEEGVDVVYPVNALAFHPVHGTFASGGGDGFVALWDGVAKRRIRQYQRYASSVSAVAFSGDGKFLAVAISPGFEDGREGVGEGVVKVFVRTLGENEAKGKGMK
ncbi:mitotic spindle checkpoint protein Bub3 [Xanthoria parietina]